MARSLRSPAPLVELGHHARRRLAAALRHTRLLTAVLSTAVLAHAPVALAQPALPDTLYTLSNGFDRSDASCSVRGWVAENRAPVVYAHVSDRFLVNSPFYGGVSSPGAVIVFTGQAATSQLSVPRASAIDAAGNVLFSDFAPAGGIAVYEVRPDGSMVQFAIFTPTTLVLYCMVRDPLNGQIVCGTSQGLYRIPAAGGTPLLWGGSGFVDTDTTLVDADLRDVGQLAYDSNNNLYCPTGANHLVRRVRPDLHVERVAGQLNLSGYTGDGGQALAARLNAARGVAVSGTTLYIGDEGNSALRAVNLTTGVITTVVTSAGMPPSFVANAGGTIYVRGPQNISRLNLVTHALEPVAGTASLYDYFTLPADSLKANELRFNGPYGLTATPAGGFIFCANRMVYRVAADGTLGSVAGQINRLVMGTRALWFGADSLSAPAEVAGWRTNHGFGNGWSQRLTSPPISYTPGSDVIKIAFDVVLEMGAGLGVGFNGLTNEYFVLEGHRPSDNRWMQIVTRPTVYAGPVSAITRMAGNEAFRVDANLSADGNPTLGQFDRLRIRFQSDRLASNEDGQQAGSMGGALVDNIQVTKNGSVLLPAATFEDQTTGGWTLSAFNGAYELGTLTPLFTRDFALPTTVPQTQSGFDALDPSCVWTFTGAGGTQDQGTYARITSPWFAGVRAATQAWISFSGRLNTSSQNSVVAIWVRGRYAGHKQPDIVAPAIARLNSGTTGGDAFAPFASQQSLSFPGSFDTDQAQITTNGIPDSLQLVFQIEDIREASGTATSGLPTRWPYLDDIRMSYSGVDDEHDGVPLGADLCPTVPSSGQDADGDGCVDAYASLHHVRSWVNGDRPLHYRFAQGGSPSVGDGSDLAAVRAAMQTWTRVDGAELTVIEDAPTSQHNATPLDGLNLITFQDPDETFDPSVLAVTAVTTLLAPGVYDDRVVRPGQIVDADMIFNPGVQWKTSTKSGQFELEAVATHEAGHFYGLSHSAVLDATMFYVIQPGRDAVTPENDDLAAMSAAYPAADFSASFGEIRGSVTRGSNGAPVKGALVSAIALDGGGAPKDTVTTDFTNETGQYGLFRLPAGAYAVRVDPLDGAANGLTAGRVNDRLAAIAETNFQGEWWSTPENDRDDPTVKSLVTVSIGSHITGISVITNVDTIPPSVVSVTPANASINVPIDALVTVAFSEPIAIPSLQSAFRLHAQGDTARVAGNGQLIDGVRLVFAPVQALEFGTDYRLDITTALTDDEGVPLAAPYSASFSTEPQPPVAITSIQPPRAARGSLITLYGTAFDATAADSVHFSGPAGSTVPAQVLSSTSLIVRVPPLADSGLVYLSQGSETSNALTFGVLPPAAQAAPATFGSPVALDFSPSDVALSPDGLTAFVVGDGGFATVDLSVSPRASVVRSTVAADGVALTPDGTRALITRRLAGQLAIVDAQPASGTFGQPLATLSGFTGPRGVAISVDGRRAFVADGTSKVNEIDLSTGPTQYTVLRTTNLGGTLTGAIAYEPVPAGYIVGLVPSGLTWVQAALDSTTRMVALQNQYAPTTVAADGGIAIAPDGREVLGAGPSTNGRLSFATVGDSAGIATVPTRGSIALGGAPRDVAIAREGQSAFMVNPPFNEMDVIDLVPTNPTYHAKVAQITTGSNPVAVAVSPLSNIVVVANAGSRTLSVFTYATSGANGIQALGPAVARPGDIVAVSGTGTGFTAGTVVDLGTGQVTADHAVGSGAAFKLPASNQRDASVTLQTPGGERSPSLPLTVVDPILGFQPKPGPLAILLPSLFCVDRDGAGYPNFSVGSPDGRIAAVLTSFPTAECNLINFINTAAEGGTPVGTMVVRATSIRGFIDVCFTPDGHQLWACQGPRPGTRFDTNPASPSYGLAIGGLGFSEAWSTAADPLGRFMLVSGGGGAIQYLTVREDVNTGAILDTLDTQNHGRMVVSPDGRWWIAYSPGVGLQIRDLDNLAAAPIVIGGHSSTDLSRLICTADGRRVLALTVGGQIGSWNLDPTAGPMGLEYFFGDPLPGHTLSELVRGPTPSSMLALSVSTPELVKLEMASGTPLAVATPLIQSAATMSSTPDGRRLWVGHASELPGGGGGPPLSTLNLAMNLVSLSEATQLSLVAGDQQSGPPSSVLPGVLRVKATDALGRPQEGVVVRFQNVIPGQGGPIVRFDGFPLTTVERLTNVNGEASVSMTLPPTPGDWPLIATAYGLGDTLHLTEHGVVGDAQIAPVVELVGPANGATNMNAGSAVFVRFNQSMQRATVQSRLTLTANGAAVSGAFTYSDGDRFVAFQPASVLPFGAACVLTMASGALDLDGQTLAVGASSSFTVQSPPALAVTALAPPAGPPGAPVSIQGAGFSTSNPGNVVTFNGTLAPVTRSGTAALETNVPIAATSGAVIVQVGGNVSTPPLNFTVLVPNGVPGSVITDLPTGSGAREVVVTPDGTRAYVSNPTSNDVTALQIAGGNVITRVPVGLSPLGLAILPSGKRAYVANFGSNNVSIIDVDPASPSYHRVLNTVRVGSQPVGVAVASQQSGTKVVVVNTGDNTLSIIDAEPGNATVDQVLATAAAGSSTKGGAVVVSQDGVTAWIGGSAGVVSINLGDQSNALIPTEAAVADVALTPNGSLLVALLENGTLLVIGAQPGSDSFNQVLATASAGSSTKGGAVVVSQDGGLAYVTLPDGNSVIVFSIGSSSGNAVMSKPGDPSVAPGPAVTLTRVSTIPVGQTPAGAAVDPNGRFAVVVNSASGTLSVIGLPNAIDGVHCEFDFDPDALTVKALGRWATAHIEPPSGYTPQQIDLSTLRINGIIPVDPPASVSYGDYDSDGNPDVTVKFKRALVGLTLPEGDHVPVHLTGRIGTRVLLGVDTIKVSRAYMERPTAGMVFSPGVIECISWTIPAGTTHRWVAGLYSFDHAETWNLITTNIPNIGYFNWTVPDEPCDSALVAAVIIDDQDLAEATTALQAIAAGLEHWDGDDGPQLRGVLALSDYFRISSTVGVNDQPVALQFAPVSPNPSREQVTLRFGLPKSTAVTLELFDVQGRRVRTLLKGVRPPGWTRVTWDGKDASGHRAGAGMYFARFRADGQSFEQRVTMLR